MEMYMPVFQKIDGSLFCLTEASLTNIFLIKGERKAMLIDAGYGFFDYVPMIKEIIGNRDLLVVLTHGHPDHALGAYLFDKAYLNEKDREFLSRIDRRSVREKALMMREKVLPGFTQETDPEAFLNASLEKTSFLSVKEGDSFDLGGILIEVYETPGHTEGSVSLLDRKNRRLFPGDILTAGNLWNFGKESSLPKLKESYEKLRSLESHYDEIWSAHNEIPLRGDILEEWTKLIDDLYMNSEEDEIFLQPMAEEMTHGVKKYSHVYKRAVLRYTKEQLREGGI